MASKPEPPPKKLGVEVTPLLIEYMKKGEASDMAISLIKARHEYGLAKYGQGLMTEDGRNTAEDAIQELGDLLQYLYKAKLQGHRLNVLLFTELMDLCKSLL